MIAQDKTITLGRFVYGSGVMALAIVCLAWRDFLFGQPVSKGLPGRTALAYAAGVFMLVTGAAVESRRTAAWAAAALTAYYVLVVVILMNGRALLTQYAYGTYSSTAEQVGIAAGGLIVYATTAKIDAVRAARLQRFGQRAFGVCALLWGGAHFMYMSLTAPLVPKWLPPSQVFWSYATGIGFIAAGVAILTGCRPAWRQSCSPP